MNNIKIQLNNSLELDIKSFGYHIIRCDNMTSFEVLEYPEAYQKSMLFYSFPSKLDGFFHIKANEIFDLKIKTRNNEGTVVSDSIEEKYLNGFNYFFINPVGIDSNGIESIISYTHRKFTSLEGKISFVLFLHHLDYHSYFEDDSVIYNPISKRKSIFSSKVP